MTSLFLLTHESVNAKKNLSFVCSLEVFQQEFSAEITSGFSENASRFIICSVHTFTHRSHNLEDTKTPKELLTDLVMWGKNAEDASAMQALAAGLTPHQYYHLQISISWTS